MADILGWKETPVMKAIGRYFLVLILWLVSGALGLAGLIQTYEATRVVAGIALPINPLETVTSQMRVVAIARVVLILLSIAWLAGVVLLLVRYYQAATSGGSLWRLFAKAMVIELIVLGLSSAVVYMLPGLVLRGSP